jgi:hypothetical protein
MITFRPIILLAYTQSQCLRLLKTIKYEDDDLESVFKIRMS